MLANTVSVYVNGKARSSKKCAKIPASPNIRSKLEIMEPKIDYFATSLPAMLLFEEDLRHRNAVEAQYPRAHACAGLGRVQESELLSQELRMGPSHAAVSDPLRQIHMLKTTFRAG